LKVISELQIIPETGEIVTVANPGPADFERCFATVFANWVGLFEMESSDGWSLVMFVEGMKFSLGVVEFEKQAFFASNADSYDPDEMVPIHWTLVPQSEIIDEDTARACLAEFCRTGRPLAGVLWRSVRMEG
jgi:hypothetical protein